MTLVVTVLKREDVVFCYLNGVSLELEFSYVQGYVYLEYSRPRLYPPQLHIGQRKILGDIFGPLTTSYFQQYFMSYKIYEGEEVVGVTFLYQSIFCFSLENKFGRKIFNGNKQWCHFLAREQRGMTSIIHLTIGCIPLCQKVKTAQQSLTLCLVSAVRSTVKKNIIAVILCLIYFIEASN